MVERSDRAPLLDWEEVPSAENPSGSAPSGSQVKDRLSSPSNSRALSGCSPPSGFGWSSGTRGPTPSRSVSNADGCSAPPATSGSPVGIDEALPPDKEEHLSDSGPEVSLEDRMVTWEEKDQIVSVFVVTFNTRSGGFCLTKYQTYKGK